MNNAPQPNKTTPPNLPIYQALIPIVVLVFLLFLNVFYAFGDDALSGSNQFLLLIGAAVASWWGLWREHGS